MALTLLGVVVIVLGFAAGLNPLLVVTAAAVVTGLAGGLDVVEVLSAFGKAFNENRYVSVVFIVLPVIGALERAGLQERAKSFITNLKAMTTFRILALYMLARQIAVALGLTSFGGQAQMVRPLIAPMAEAAAEAQLGPLPTQTRERIRAQAGAAENIGLFFGEDIFIAIGSILLMRGFLQQNGILVEPLDLSVWAIPTAIAAAIIHSIRLYLFERKLTKDSAAREKAQT